MASQRWWLRTERQLDRAIAGVLVIGAAGDLFAAYRYAAELIQLHRALRDGVSSVENLDPGTAVPTVWVLAGFAVGFAVLSALVALLILRASPAGMAALRAGGAVLLPARLLAFVAGYVRYQEYVDAMPSASRDPAYRSAIIGEVIGGAVGFGAVVVALVALVVAMLVRWFRPGPDRWATPAGQRPTRPLPQQPAPLPPGPPDRAIRVARVSALAAALAAALAPLAWVRPVNGPGTLPSEWSIIAAVSALLVAAVLVVALLTVAVRPGRLVVGWLTLSATVVVGAALWVVVLWQSFYADVAFGSERVSGVGWPWAAAVVCGLLSGCLLAVVATALTLPPADATRTAAPER